MCSSTRRKLSSKLLADFFEPRVSYGARLTPNRLTLGSHPAQSRPRVTARKNALVRWTSVLHHSMQTEIGRQLRAEYELPQELSTELASSLARLDKSLAFAGAAPPEVRLRFYKCEDRRRRLLLRAIACEETACRALNEGIKEIASGRTSFNGCCEGQVEASTTAA